MNQPKLSQANLLGLESMRLRVDRLLDDLATGSYSDEAYATAMFLLHTATQIAGEFPDEWIQHKQIPRDTL